MSNSDDIYKGAEGFKAWAEAQLSQQHDLFASMLEQHTALYRWILAARLTVNGGAAIAVLNSENIGHSSAVVALVLFVIGILTAIVGAELDQMALQHSFRFNAHMIGFWSKAVVTGNFDAGKLREIGDETGGDNSKAMPGKCVGWASLAAFVIGAGIIGCDIANLTINLQIGV